MHFGDRANVLAQVRLDLCREIAGSTKKVRVLLCIFLPWYRCFYSDFSRFKMKVGFYRYFVTLILKDPKRHEEQASRGFDQAVFRKALVQGDTMVSYQSAQVRHPIQIPYRQCCPCTCPLLNTASAGLDVLLRGWVWELLSEPDNIGE